MILCKNSVGGSAKQDSDGNASAEAHASHTEKDTRGNSSSFSVKGEVKKDKDGTVKAEAKVSYEREF